MKKQDTSIYGEPRRQRYGGPRRKNSLVKFSKSRRVDLDPYVMGYILWSRTAIYYKHCKSKLEHE